MNSHEQLVDLDANRNSWIKDPEKVDFTMSKASETMSYTSSCGNGVNLLFKDENYNLCEDQVGEIILSILFEEGRSKDALCVNEKVII